MKIVNRIHYERGDFVMILRGYNKGMVGIVRSHDLEDRNVSVLCADHTPGSWDEDDDDTNYYNEGHLKFINKAEYEQGIKDNKILRVEGLPVPIQMRGKNLVIGDNVVTPANAKKIAEFITTHTNKKGRK